MKELYDILFETKSIQIDTNNPFTFASGIKSPIYCDTRRLISYPKERKMILSGFLEKTSKLKIDCVIGVATGGVSWGAWLSDWLDVPFGYVRSSNKDYGKKQSIEGDIDVSKNILVIEDVVSTGGSIGRAINLLKQSSASSLNAFSIFSYQFSESLEMFQKLNVPFESLLTLEGLLEHSSDKIGDNKSEIQLWKKNHGSGEGND
ncbi:MAG: Orotate phosphoribosyltransferase [Candidatus Methanofastidiosum methylothiophilum]|uniref:Orotate phosphoribosyltransferase n=1 Tax=Candidatus Methanofastidiosum methylothiophilum TaxID=1705564 RepID=A0A150IMQ5_9EURY|nr:MAG: Orotate phosphoribosyltransferase [Candidatus Methanofastidiosum methylthiophilus]KYC47117.1 MAG: Orotate phosphoribosyltransferase [Candidatus Methanofastidiosum methylthiophilus]KYC51225.1 MAG: Orotate phosphoribosyltransferase [Candidatus Methanofastidiosum methylthiophilus]